MKTLIQGKKLGYLVAGIGALVALFAFFVLPYFSYSITPSPAEPNGVWEFDHSVGARQIATIQGTFWLEALLPLVALVLAAFFLFRRTTRRENFGLTRCRER